MPVIETAPISARSSKKTLRAFALTAIVAGSLLGSLAIAGCGGSDEPASTATGAQSGDGKQVFVDAGCGGCHTLAAAGSSGGSGPNLDELKPTTIEVASKVKQGGGGMPAFNGDLTNAQIAAVAKYVADSAGK